jgi:predicted MFS family arabinose efflux permease
VYRLFIYKFLADFWVIVPILVPFYKAHGMSATQILTIQAAYSLSQLLFEIPSGYCSDCIGRRKTLIAAAALLFTGVCLYSFSGDFWMFVTAEIVLGIAGALRSGTDSAMLYDTLRETNAERRYVEFEGRAEFWCRTGTAVSSIAGGMLGAFAAIRLPFYVNSITALAMVAIAFTLREPRREKQPHGNALMNICIITRDSIAHPSLLAVMLLSGIIVSTGVTAIWGYFMFYGKTGVPLYWYGVIFAIMQMASAFGARHAHDITSRIGPQTSFWLLIGIGPLLCVFSLTESRWIVPIVFAHALIWGMSTPQLLDRINILTTSDIRATTLSVGSMIGRIMTIGAGPLFGWITDHYSLKTAFGAMGLVYCIAVPVLLRRTWCIGGKTN